MAYEQLLTTTSTTAEKSLLDDLHQTYRLALNPSTFFNSRMWGPGEQFEQCYELLRVTFDPAELQSKETFLEIARSLKKPQSSFTPIIIGRYWRTLGLQQYDVTGKLLRFSFDPLAVTENVVGVISGSYMRIPGSSSKHESFGGIGYAAIRSHFRQGHGHGRALVEAFEREVEALAAAQGDTLRLVFLEAQAGSRKFWARLGYRWPANSRYFQPPIEFDPVTGELSDDEVPEYLMVKILEDPDASHIDSRLLEDVVHTAYQKWYLRNISTYTSEAARRASDYVFGKLFAGFVASLPGGGDPVPLQMPPVT